MGSAAVDPYERADEAAAAIRTRLGGRHDVLVVAGSGWAGALDDLGAAEAVVSTDELPGFATPAIDGHHPELRSVRAGSRRVLVALGRLHAYEGHPLDVVVHPVRAAILAGCGVVVLTNAAGALRPELPVGRPVLIRDHLNLTGASPLTGPHPAVGPRFPDLSDAYSSRLRDLARRVEPTLDEGIYAGVSGPQYETPAEIRMLRTLGADLVGMSTVPETIAAVQLGAEVLGLSLVTNQAAGLGAPLDHADVLAEASRSVDAVGALVAGIVEAL